MPTVITETEYLEVNSLPLSTPAWKTTDLSGLYDAPGVRGEDRLVPYHEGVLPLRRWIDSKRVQIPIIVFGARNKEDALHPDIRTGLQLNTDELKKTVLRPRQNDTDEGVRTVRHHLPDGTVRAADGIAIPPLQFEPLAVDTLKGVMDLLIPKGLFRDEAFTDTGNQGPYSVNTDIVVSNPGTADQYECIIELSGTATSVRLVSKTWDTSLNTFLDFNGTLGTLTTIDTGLWTADRDGTSVIGLIDHSGHERWLPLLPGNNTIAVEPTGGNVTVKIKHKAGWL